MNTDHSLVMGAGMGVRRAGRWLIRDVDLAVRPGEIVTLIGPNGGGKTTTAKAALGLVALDKGRLERAAGLRVGYVPQKLSLDPALPLTARRLMTLTGTYSKAEIDRALDEVGLAHMADAPVRNLSGGEFQRALLARALIRGPDLLVLDEPAQGVDISGEAALYDLIGRSRDRLGCGVLLVSHDLHIVMAATDTVICLNGHVCCHGAPETVSADAAYLGLFGDRTTPALAVYRHNHDHAHEPDGTIAPLDKDHGHAG